MYSVFVSNPIEVLEIHTTSKRPRDRCNIRSEVLLSVAFAVVAVARGTAAPVC
jgi:hypothetical protein